jgi:hypothetical protein
MAVCWPAMPSEVKFAADSLLEGAVTSEPSPEPAFPVRWENTGYLLIFGSISPNLSWKSQSRSRTYRQIPCGTEQGIIFGPIRGIKSAYQGSFRPDQGKALHTRRQSGEDGASSDRDRHGAFSEVEE